MKADHAGVIAPPPLLFLGMLGLAACIDFWVWRLPTGLAVEWRQALAAMLGGGAVPLLAGALGRFRGAGTRPEPWKPSTAVVTTGVYRFTRNPMYLAMSLVYLALSLLLDSGVALVFFAPLIVLVRVAVIDREERYMERKFGEEYLSYKRAVRRWF